MTAPLRRLSLFALLALCLAAPLAARDAPYAAQGASYAVGVVPASDDALAVPAGRQAPLTEDQVLDMVRRAVDLVGGMAAYVPDTARTVLLKANISIPEASGSGVITDARVIRAVALLVHEVAPRAKVLIAEGAGGWMSPQLAHLTELDSWEKTDGFEVGGYRAVAAELRARGIDIECHDLNFDEAYFLEPEGGAFAHDEYAIAAAIIDSDVYINVPVAKTHGAKITVCLKNQFGILPGTVYGWSKNRGTREHGPMPHSPRVLDEAWVDIYNVARIDLNVVDMIAGSQGGAFEENDTHRANTVLAGANPIAVDLVAARLMGFNPDDFEFAELAWQRGLGPRNLDGVDVRGVDDLAPHARRWKKAVLSYGGRGEWAEHSGFGMGPRTWTLFGPVARDHAFPTAQLASLSPHPGQDGWSTAVTFGHDRIDLDKHFDDPVNAAVYAFTRFTMATSDSVRLWVGSDEELTVWIDGQVVYEHEGRRRHALGMDRVPAYIEAGEHRLLVRAGQGRGGFEFSINVTEPIDDVLYAGNRYPGVRYYLDDRDRPRRAAQRVAADDVGDRYSPPSLEASVVRFEADDPLLRSRTAPDTILVDAPPADAEDLFGLLVAGAGDVDIDPLTLRVLSEMPFTITGRSWRSRPFDPPELSRLLDWLGLRYALSYGYGGREALKTMQGWLDQGYVPVTAELRPERGRRFRGPRPSSWRRVTGLRTDGEVTELRLAGPRGERWQTAPESWTGTLPGGVTADAPVLTVAPGIDNVSEAAIVDSIAALAVDLGWPRWVDEEEDWGTQRQPAGLALWDEWVISWERFPLTREWAENDEPVLDRLERMGRYPFPQVAEGRALAAEFFARAAAGSVGARGALLSQAARGYAGVAEATRALLAILPENDSPEELTDADRERLSRLPEARPLLRRARDAERAALTALARLVGLAPLPPVREDPLTYKDRGIRLFTWRAVTEDAVRDLVLEGDGVRMALLEGDEEENASVRVEVHAAMPRQSGWTAAVEPVAGQGEFHVVEQPSADNGWRVVVRADDSWVRDGNEPHLVVWALPPR